MVKKQQKTLIKLLALLFALLFPAALFNGCAVKTKIVVAGSTSVQPYAELLAEEFERLHPRTKIDVSGGGTSTGIDMAIKGTAQIGMSSRALKPDSDKEKALKKVEIALDGLAVIVHPKNPVSNLSVDEIRKIYTGETKSWEQIKDGWNQNIKSRNADIHIVTREDGSGTRSAFQDNVMGTSRITAGAIVFSSNGAIRNYVSGNPNSIGFISLGLVKSKKGEKDVQALSLDNVEATAENVKNGSYRLSRPFLFVFTHEPTGLAKEFIDFVMSDDGQAILDAKGLIISNK